MMCFLRENRAYIFSRKFTEIVDLEKYRFISFPLSGAAARMTKLNCKGEIHGRTVIAFIL